MTWLLVITNCLVFVFLSYNYADVDREYDRILQDTSHMRVQGEVFAEFIKRHPANYSPTYLRVADRAAEGHGEALMALAALAVRDTKFTREGVAFHPQGDDIAVSKWRRYFSRFVKVQKENPSQILGLSNFKPCFAKTITYQFIHGGVLHLVANMFVLLLFGCFLETIVNSWLIFVVYIVTGIAAAYSFYGLTGLTMAPLIGASGAINGLIGFFVVLNWREKINYIYFLLPKNGYWGFVEIPVWAFFIFWILTDFASLMATVDEVGGIAYSAHLGGIISGMLMGGFLLIWRKATAHSVLAH